MQVVRPSRRPGAAPTIRETAAAWRDPVAGRNWPEGMCQMSGVLYRVGRACFANRWLVVGIWLAVMVAAGAGMKAGGGQYVSDNYTSFLVSYTSVLGPRHRWGALCRPELAEGRRPPLRPAASQPDRYGARQRDRCMERAR
jgi:hypothetical protein